MWRLYDVYHCEQSRSLLDGLDICKTQICKFSFCFVRIVSNSVIFTYVYSISTAIQCVLFLGKYLCESSENFLIDMENCQDFIQNCRISISTPVLFKDLWPQ